MSKGRVLSIRLSNTQLMGVIDLLEIKLLKEPSIALSTNIVDVLDIVINNARKSGDIPYYENEVQAGELLAEKVRGVGKALVQRDKQVRLATSYSFGTDSFKQRVQGASATIQQGDEFAPLPIVTQQVTQETMGTPFDDLEDIFTETIQEIQQQEEEDLWRKLGSVEVTDGTKLETPKLKQDIAAIELNDPRLDKDYLYNCLKLEEEKKVLRIVYFNLPHHLWSSEQAKKLYEMTFTAMASSIK